MKFVVGSSSYLRLEIHVTFKVKYCHRVFDITEFKNRCQEIFFAVAKEQNVDIEEIGFDGDHVHMVWLLRVYHRIDMVTKAFKGTSGRKLLDEFPLIKRECFWGSGLWSGVIYGDSMGREPEAMKSYVRNQEIKSSKNQKSLRDFSAEAERAKRARIPPVY